MGLVLRLLEVIPQTAGELERTYQNMGVPGRKLWQSQESKVGDEGETFQKRDYLMVCISARRLVGIL